MGEADRKRRKRALEFETLESVTLQSGLSAWVPQSASTEAKLAPAATGPVNAKAVAVSVNGVARGAASFQRQNADVGLLYSLGTNGSFKGLGRAVVSGMLQTVGSVAQGQATGTLTLNAHKGSLALRLTGPTQSGFASLPSTFLYSVTAGAGRLAGATGNGTVEVTFRPFPAPPNVRMSGGSGKMTLTFHANTGAMARA